jgi:hypothetical protein
MFLCEPSRDTRLLEDVDFPWFQLNPGDQIRFETLMQLNRKCGTPIGPALPDSLHCTRFLVEVVGQDGSCRISRPATAVANFKPGRRVQLAVCQEPPGKTGWPFDAYVDNDRARLPVSLDAIDSRRAFAFDNIVSHNISPLVATVSWKFPSVFLGLEQCGQGSV